MLTQISKKSVSHQGKNLLLVAVALLTLNQSVSVYAGHPGANPRPDQSSKAVQVEKSNKSSASGIISDVRKMYEKLVQVTKFYLGRP